MKKPTKKQIDSDERLENIHAILVRNNITTVAQYLERSEELGLAKSPYPEEYYISKIPENEVYDYYFETLYKMYVRPLTTIVTPDLKFELLSPQRTLDIMWPELCRNSQNIPLTVLTKTVLPILKKWIKSTTDRHADFLSNSITYLPAPLQILIETLDDYYYNDDKPPI